MTVLSEPTQIAEVGRLIGDVNVLAYHIDREPQSEILLEQVGVLFKEMYETAHELGDECAGSVLEEARERLFASARAAWDAWLTDQGIELTPQLKTWVRRPSLDDWDPNLPVPTD